MFEFKNLSVPELHKICCGCLRMGEDVHLMSPEDMDSYLLIVNKSPSVKMEVHICIICKYLIKKFARFVRQCQKANNVLSDIILKDNQESYTVPIKLVYNLKQSNVTFVEYPNFEKEINIMDSDSIFDSNIYLDDEDIPLVMLKKEDLTEYKVKKRKRKWGTQTKNGQIKEKKKKGIAENIYKNQETENKIIIPNGEDIKVEIEIKLEEDKKKKKTIVKDGFSSRMVQETDEYTVIKLSKDQVLKEMEEKSRSNEYLRSLYKCEKCVKGFIFEEVLTRHMDRHVMKKGWLHCELCQQYCPSVISLRGHMKSHTTRYKCKVCGCVRLSRQVLLEHYAICHTSDALKYTCQQCEFVTNKRTSIQRHVRTRHNKTEKHPCDKCGKTLNSIEALRVHSTSHDKSKRMKCDECDRWFVFPSLLAQHKMGVHTNTDHYCVECDVKFKSRENLSLHFKRNKRHRDVSTFRYSCSHCNKRFIFPSALSGHVTAAHNTKRHTDTHNDCGKCKKRKQADPNGEQSGVCECEASFNEYHKKDANPPLPSQVISTRNEVCESYEKKEDPF